MSGGEGASTVVSAPGASAALLAALADLAVAAQPPSAAGVQVEHSRPRHPDVRAELLADRPESTVLRVGAVAAKAHAPATVAERLRAQVRFAARPTLADVFVAPLASGGQQEFVQPRETRLVTCWPVGEPVDANDPEAVPWAEAAQLLARLHTVPVDHTLPRAGSPRRVRAVLRALVVSARAGQVPHQQAATVWSAARTLRSGRPHPRAVVHGDWHLGQMVRLDGSGWRLIDIDDLGVGEPAWDLARPAAWYATGLLPPTVWQGFLAAYRDHGGRVGRAGEPWPVELEMPARAATVYLSARAVLRAARDGREVDEVEEVLLDGCARIADILPAVR